MKLGFITSILDGWTYEQMMDFASGHEAVRSSPVLRNIQDHGIPQCRYRPHIRYFLK